MSKLLDGHVFPISFRAHDNKFVNSPRAVYPGDGYLVSNVLSMGEPGFDNINLVFSMGNGGAKGLSAISVDRKSISIRADLTPVIGNGGGSIMKDFLVRSAVI